MLEKLRGHAEDLNRLHIAAGVLLLALAIGFVAQSLGTTDSLEFNSQLKTQSGAMPAELDATGDAGRYGSSGSTADTEDRKLVTRIYMDVETEDVQAAQTETKELARGYGGFVDQESFSQDDGQRASVTLRIPEDNVSIFLSDVENRWELESSNRNTDDVTDRYTELTLELKNKRQELRQLEDLINRSEEVEDLIKIQERMSELRSRIQYLENSLEDLDRQVEYTRIQINFEEPQPITADFELREAIRDAYRAVFQSLNLMIVGLGYLLPFMLVYGLYRGGRRLARKRQQ